MDKMPRPALAAALRNRTVVQASQLYRARISAVSRLHAPHLLISEYLLRTRVAQAFYKLTCCPSNSVLLERSRSLLTTSLEVFIRVLVWLVNRSGERTTRIPNPQRSTT